MSTLNDRPSCTDRQASMRCRAVVGVALLLPALIGVRAAAEDENKTWKTGADWQTALESPVGISWSAIPLRDGLQTVADQQQIGIFLDRRVDPHQPVDFVRQLMPLDLLLEQLAAENGLRLGAVGPLLYIGPANTTAKLATLTELKQEQARRLPADIARRLSRRQSWSWQRLSVPRELLAQLLDEHQLTLEGIDQIPHDLWPEVQLPPMSVLERLILILAGFDRTVDWDEQGQLRIVELPDHVAISKSYPAQQLEPFGDQLTRWMPEAVIRRTSTRVHIETTWENHRQLDRMIRNGGRGPETPAGRAVYSLTPREAPVGAILREIAKQTGLRLVVDPAAADQLETRVSFSVKDVDLDTLLQKTLHDAGLTFERDDSELRILLAR